MKRNLGIVIVCVGIGLAMLSELGKLVMHGDIDRDFFHQNLFAILISVFMALASQVCIIVGIVSVVQGSARVKTGGGRRTSGGGKMGGGIS